MNTITFDTLAYSRKLQSCGVPQAQANGMAEAQKEAFEQMISTRELATKRDLLELEARLAKSHNAMLAWVAGLMVAQATFIVTALAWLLK